MVSARDWGARETATVGTLVLATCFGRCLMFEDGDDHVFARVMVYPPASADDYAPLTNYLAVAALGSNKDRAIANMPLVTRYLLDAAGSADVVRAQPLEVLPAFLAILEVTAALALFVALPGGYVYTCAAFAAVAGMVSTPAVSSPVHSLLVWCIALLAIASRHRSAFAALLGGLLTMLLILSEAHLLPMLIPWICAASRARIPPKVSIVWVVTCWQLFEALKRADLADPVNALADDDPRKYTALLEERVAAAVDTGLWSSGPHFGNSWMTYQLLFTRFHLGTRIVTLVFGFIPTTLIAVVAFGATPGNARPATIGALVAMALLSASLFGRWTHPSQFLLAFAAAPETSIRIQFGFFIAGAFVVLVPLLISYRYAWLELGSMPQPNMPFYGGSFYAFNVALYLVQLSTRVALEAQVRLGVAEAGRKPPSS